MKRLNKTHLDSFCGMYCGACPQEECYGCKSGHVEDFCVDCDFKNCPLMTDIESCGECIEYPCNTLQKFNDDKYPHHSTAIPNLNEIREHGVEKWLENQDITWRCPECNTPFTWYETECKHCGNKVNGFIFSLS